MGLPKSVATKQYGGEGHPDLTRLIPVGIQSVLDIGCGCGKLASFLKTRGVVMNGITIPFGLARSWVNTTESLHT